MSKGFFERKTIQRVPFQAELKILFKQGEQEIVVGEATDLSPGGLNFYLSDDMNTLYLGQEVELILILPTKEEIAVNGEVRHISGRQGIGDKPLTCYGICFINLSQEDWEKIHDYCRTKIKEIFRVGSKPNEVIDQSTNELKGQKDYRIGVSYPVSLMLKDGRQLAGWLKDISYGGARVILGEPLKIKSSLIISLAFLETYVELEATCVWCLAYDGEDKEEYMAGIYFTSPNREQFIKLQSLVYGLSSRSENI